MKLNTRTLKKEAEALKHIANEEAAFKRFKEAIKCLTGAYQKRFKGCNVSHVTVFHVHKTALLQYDGLTLLWKLRAMPNMAESYKNQQTTSGLVELIFNS